MRTLYISVIVLALSLSACSDDDVSKKDGSAPADQSGKSDGGGTQDSTPAPDSAPPKDSAPAGTLSMDQICTPGSSGAKGCKSGLLCVRFGTAEGICLPSVVNCTTGTCASGRVCLKLNSGKGVCGKDCTTKACPTKTECQELTTASKKVCTPVHTGPKTFGQICKSSGTTNFCKKGLICLREKSTSTSGYCAENCKSKTCPKVKDSKGKEFTPTCHSLSSGTKICVFACDKTGATCPTGLSCKTVSSKKFCLAP